MSTRKPEPGSLEGRLRAAALAYPAATEDFPWGERAIKVGGKAFLFMRAEGGSVSFSVKLPHSAAAALEQPFAEPTHYGLGKHGWVTCTVDATRHAPIEVFLAWLDESFRAVAPKRVVAQLDSPASTLKPKTAKRSARKRSARKR
jgi:predicted DNA-binding protein (MmcQ/YjbR family)